MRPLRGPSVGAAPGFEDFAVTRYAPLLGLARVLVRWSRVSVVDDPVAYTNRMLVNAATSWHRRPSRRESATVLDDERPAPDALPRRQRAVLVLRHHEGLDDAAPTGSGQLHRGPRRVAR